MARKQNNQNKQIKQENLTGVIGKDVQKHIDSYKKLYENASPAERSALDQRAADYGYTSDMEDVTLNVAVDGAFGKSKIITNLIIKATQQKVFSTNPTFIETILQSVETIPNGAWFINYTENVEGSSKYNNDVFAPVSGESKTARSAYSDVVIGDYNGKPNPAFEETAQVDDQFSRKIPILSNVLNDFALSQPVYMAIVKEINKYLDYSLENYNYKRTLDFFSQNDQYSKVFTYAADSFKAPTDATTLAALEANLRALINDIKSYALATQTPRRKWLNADPSNKTTTAIIPNGSTTPLIYDGKENTRFLMIDAHLISQIRTYLFAGTFQLSQLELPKNIKLIEVDFTAWLEWFPSITQPTKLGKLITGTPLFLFADQGCYREFQWFTLIKTIDTPKAHSIMNIYIERGFLRNKTKLMTIGGIAPATPAK